MPSVVRTPGLFLSTPSARRATSPFCSPFFMLCISIHALREEGDDTVILQELLQPDFYPRPPRGGRLHVSRHKTANQRFLSTPSARRATGISRARLLACSISIHALREEGDAAQRTMKHSVIRFLSTPSARRATQHELPKSNGRHISIHALREEGDSKNRDKISIFKQIIQHSARI